MLRFDDTYYRDVIQKYHYDAMDFNPIDFELNGISTRVLQYKWLCHYKGDVFANALHDGQKCIVTTGIGLSGTPHLGTLSQILRTIFLQRAGLNVQLVLGDLDSYNARNQPLDVVLERAEKLLRVGKESGVWSKLNILLYPGETMSTIKETKMWLRKVKSNVKGISCNGLVIYLNGKDTDSYVDTIERMAGVSIDRNTLYRQGYVNARLGTGIDEEKIVNEFYQEFMTEQDYMDLKKITYLRRIEG